LPGESDEDQENPQSRQSVPDRTFELPERKTGNRMLTAMQHF